MKQAPHIYMAQPTAIYPPLSAPLLQKESRKIPTPRHAQCLLLNVTNHEKESRKRKIKKQSGILIAEFYELPIQGDSISYLPLAD
jgi:hypothetical protein